MFEILKERLIWEKKFTKSSYGRFKKELVYTRNNVIDSDGNMSFTVDYLIENKLYQRLDQFHEMKITPVKFYSITLSKIHILYDGSGRTCKPLFSNDDKVKSLLMRQKLK